ncbi:predicted protein [Botrytis cinerea T4]|uniref:Uncharacterized protein n=1 Tax=Botryotinia fuckeliana (strain T4) TaxID=999810 RepID=G2Y975_BOTF4|nr:predicted protein [Botrytis cinerea T4]
MNRCRYPSPVPAALLQRTGHSIGQTKPPYSSGATGVVKNYNRDLATRKACYPHVDF